MKCKICKKPLKENTDGDNKYCQGHSIWDKIREVRGDKKEGKR